MRKGVTKAERELLTGWIYTDAALRMNCPRCGEKAGGGCRTPKGRRTTTPHRDRTDALIRKFGVAPFSGFNIWRLLPNEKEV